MPRLFFVSILCLILFAFPVSALTKLRLPNGLTVLTEPQPATQLVTLQLFVNAGSNDETDAERGLSHVIEHMVFKGSKKYSDIAKQVQSIGGNINAYTNYNATSFYLTVPAENVDQALDLLVDMVFNPVFDANELTKEEEVICNEINMRQDSPPSRVYEMLFSELYPSYNLGNRIIGTKDTVRSFSRADLLRYYSHYYAPNNMALVLVGDIPDNLLSRVSALTETYAAHPVRTYASSVPVTLAPPSVISVTGNVEQTHFALGFRIPEFLAADIPVLDVMTTLLGSGASSRLSKVLKEQRKLVTSISSGIYSANYPGAFIISGTTTTTNVSLVLRTVAEQMDLLKKTQVSQPELNKIVASVRSSAFFDQEDSSALANQLGFYEMMGDVGFKKDYESKLTAVTAVQIQDAAIKYFDSDKISVSLYMPEENVLPLQSDFNGAFSVLRNSTLNSSVAATNTRPTGFRRLQFENGVKVILREDHTSPIVAVGVYRPSSFLQETSANNGITSLALRTAFKGTKNRSFDQISDLLDQQAISLGPLIDKTVSGFSGAAVSDKFDLLMGLMSDVMLNAVFSSDEVAKERALQLHEIQTRSEDAFAYAQYRADRVLFAGLTSQFSLAGDESSVSAITPQMLKKWFYDQYNPNDLTYVFSGDLSEKQVRSALAHLLSATAPPKKIAMPDMAPYRTEPKYKEKVSLDKEQTVVLIKYQAPPPGSKEYFTIRVLNSILSGMGSRLFETLRDQNHLAYSTGSFVSPGLPFGCFTAYAMVPPGNDAQAAKLIRQELARLTTENVSENELAKAKKVVDGAYRSQLQTRSEQCALVGRFEIQGLGYEEVPHFIEHINAVTSADIMQVAKKYLSEGSVQVVVGR